MHAAENADTDTKKACLDERNAYMLILKLCEGHEVANLLDLQSVPMGHARKALDVIADYFNPNSTAGRQNLIIKFMTSTQATTNTTIVEWLTAVNTNAQRLLDIGEPVNDSAKLAVLLKGLLPIFEPIQHTCNTTPNLTVLGARKLILDYATNKDLLERTRSTGRKPDKTFMASDGYATQKPLQPPRKGDDRGRGDGGGGARLSLEEKAKMPCPSWSSYRKCRWGPKCHYSHAGEGGTPGDAARLALKAKEGETAKGSSNLAAELPSPSRCFLASGTHYGATMEVSPDNMQISHADEPCYLCQSLGHSATNCPAAQEDEISLAYVAGESHSGVPSASMGESGTMGAGELLMALMAVLMAHIVGLGGSVLSGAQSIIRPFFSDLDGNRHYSRQRGWDLRSISRLSIVIVVALLAWNATASDVEPLTAMPSISDECFSALDEGTTAKGNFEWCVDTGTSRFITNDLNDFVPGTVRQVATELSVAGGTTTSKCQGTVHIYSPDSNETISCSNVLYLPQCGKKLMPVRQFVNKNCSFQISKGKACLLSPEGEPLLVGKEIEGLYFYHAVTVRHIPSAEPEVSFTEGDHDEVPDPSGPFTFFGLPFGRVTGSTGRDFVQKLMETHVTLGHLHFDKVRKLFGLKKGDNPDCATCDVAFMKKEHLKENRPRATRVNHRIHVDLAFTNGGPPFQVYLDDYTRVSHLDVLATKGEAFGKWVELKRHLENRHFDCKVAFLRTDNDTVYTSKEFIQHCLEEGVEHEYSPHFRHDLNGSIERTVQTIGVTFRVLMFHGNAPDSDIPDALLHANVIRNNSPTKANNGWTPKERELGMKLGPNRRLLKGPLFCLVYAMIYKEQRGKDGAQGVACVYLGYDDHNDQYKVKEWVSGRVYYTGDGTFHPSVFPYRASPQYAQQWMNEIDSITPSIPVAAANLAPNPMPTGPRRSIRMHDFYTEFQQSGNRALADIPDADVAPESAANMVYFVHSFGPDPDNWGEALQSRFANEWIEACLQEKNSFEEHGVYHLVPRSSVGGKKIYRPRPVFKIKVNPPDRENPHPTLEKFKYRLTIAAFARTMTAGVDFEEKRASTVRWEATLAILGIANHYHLGITLFDIKTFFLYGDLHDDVYMEQPPEWVDDQHSSVEYVCKLDKSMYGLPQAPHRAQERLKEVLMDAGFYQTSSDDCVYVWGSPGNDDFAVVGTHVDDITCAATDKGRARVREALTKVFKVTEKHSPTLITAVQVVRDEGQGWLKLHQAAYVDEILEEFDMKDANTVSTPMDPGTATALMDLPLANEDDIDKSLVKRYQKLVGMLIWLHKTRPDLLFTINLLARFLKSPTLQHFELAKNRVLRYLKGSKFYGVVFVASEEGLTLSAQCDADLAGDRRTSRSTSGYFSKLGKFGAVSFHSMLERKVSTSTQQAETYALAWGIRDVLWLRTLLHEIGVPVLCPTRVDTDNQGVFLQSSKQVNHATAKHFRISQAFIRQVGEDGFCDVEKIDTKLNHSDIFTKALNPELFRIHRAAIMGPQAPPSTAIK